MSFLYFELAIFQHFHRAKLQVSLHTELIALKVWVLKLTILRVISSGYSSKLKAGMGKTQKHSLNYKPDTVLQI